MDIYQLIKNDHRTVSNLMRSSKETTDSGARKELFAHMRAEMLAHARAEGALVYIYLENEEATDDLVKRARQEHDEVDRLLDELSTISENDEQWMSTFPKIDRAIERHIRMEEENLLPRAQKIFNDDQARNLAKTMKEEKQNSMRAAV